MQALSQRLAGRRAPAVLVITGINVAALLLLEVLGGSTDIENLIRFGAKVNDLIAKGEYWRLVTSVFLHVGFAHLLFNTWALWAFGTALEKIYGTGRFVIIYVLSGIAGATASYFLSPGVSAGASGAIFGLIGLSFVFGLRYRDSIPPRYRSRFGTGVVPVIIYNILYGIRPGSHIDNFAHIGGLVGGIMLGWVIPADYEQTEDPLIR